jgi:hypothetical protein
MTPLPPESNEAVSERLKLLRTKIARENQKQFCARLKIGISRWNQIENCRPLSKGVAFLLVRHFPGITLDWLFLGVTGGLPVNLQREIEVARAEL